MLVKVLLALIAYFYNYAKAMLVVANYAHFSKKCRKYAFTYYFRLLHSYCLWTLTINLKFYCRKQLLSIKGSFRYSGAILWNSIVKVSSSDIPLISRVRGPYCKLWTEFFPSIYGPSAKRAGHENKEGKNEYPYLAVRTEQTRLIRCLLYGFVDYSGF